MSKLYVKLKDPSSIFTDVSQNVTVSGEVPYEVVFTERLKNALKHGVLVKVDEKEAKPLIEKHLKKIEALDAVQAEARQARRAEDKDSKLLKERMAALVKEGKAKDNEIAQLKANEAEGGGDCTELQEKITELTEVAELSAEEVEELKGKLEGADKAREAITIEKDELLEKVIELEGEIEKLNESAKKANKKK